MNISRIIPVFLFSLFALAAASLPASAQDPFVNGSFETGDFQGWTVFQQPGSGGDWFVYQGDQLFPLPSPPSGQYAAATNQEGPSSQILFQDIFVPAGENALCSVIVYYDNAGGSFVIGPGLAYALDDNQQARIDIISTDADPFTVSSGVLLNVFQTEPGDPNELGYTTVEFDLSPYAGTTVRFRAAEVDNLGVFNFAIDDVNCGGGAAVTGIPTLGEWGMTAMAGVLGIAGLLYARRKRVIS